MASNEDEIRCFEHLVAQHRHLDPEMAKGVGDFVPRAHDVADLLRLGLDVELDDLDPALREIDLPVDVGVGDLHHRPARSSLRRRPLPPSGRTSWAFFGGVTSNVTSRLVVLAGQRKRKAGRRDPPPVRPFEADRPGDVLGMAFQPDLHRLGTVAGKYLDAVFDLDRHPRPDLEGPVKLAVDLIRPAKENGDGIFEKTSVQAQDEGDAQGRRIFGQAHEIAIAGRKRTVLRGRLQPIGLGQRKSLRDEDLVLDGQGLVVLQGPIDDRIGDDPGKAEAMEDERLVRSVDDRRPDQDLVARGRRRSRRRSPPSRSRRSPG